MTAILHLEDVTRQRGRGPGSFRVEVPRLSVAAGECVAITGPSGSGKSTLLDLLGLVGAPESAGRFALRLTAGEAVDVAALWARDRSDALAELRGRGVGYVLQTGGLLPFLTVRDNIALSCRLTGKAAGERVAALARVLGLERHLTRKPRDLSIGERQRVAIARALAHGPALVVADEPTASLDPANAERVMALFLHLARTLGVAVVVASHDWELLGRHGVRRIDASLARTEGGTVARFDGAAA
ncbi:ABC transporter ATP-binding protein [Azospirillum sp. TSO22-1]|uniref:ABC transporter ATP-binding protein n=1 Tax=Azospirillum sp. TSO22-1 TaxID=716789 RepID=UPI000D60EAF6|nr:ABC transporter ATP-binding protein [Azospirillum sp. TSO22-1]PWC40177.1 ABC transporter ATP-binding protein [Azospirillum sp. TSO22-1]